MLDRLAAWVDGHNRNRWLVGLLIAFLALSSLFPLLYAQMESDATLIDGQFGSPVEDTYRLLDALGPEDRAWYAGGELTLDLAYPLVYSSLLALLLTRALPAAFPGSEMLARLRLLPFGAGLFDLLENLSIVALIAAYPARWAGLARLMSIFNQSKWILVGASLALLLLSVLVAAARRWGAQE